MAVREGSSRCCIRGPVEVSRPHTKCSLFYLFANEDVCALQVLSCSMMFYHRESANTSCDGLRGARSLFNARMDDRVWCPWWIWDRRVVFERGMRMEMLGRIWKCGRDGLTHSIRGTCNEVCIKVRMSQYMTPAQVLLLDTIWIIMMYTYIYI